MCLILTSYGKEIEREQLECGFKSNPHGSGISYLKDGKLILEKGFFKFEELYEVYKKTIGLPMILHTRWKTHGETDKENCHPFIIDENLHFCHNGVLHGFSQNPKMSDTFNFGEERLKPLTRDTQGKKWWKNSGFKWLIESFIGTGNKLALLDSDGEITIFNEAAGEWVDEEKTIWASNTSYKVLKTRNDPRTIYTGFAGYESDYMNNYQPRNYNNGNTPVNKPTNSNLLLENGSNKAILPAGLWEISEEELKEVDNYLETLNKD